MLKLLQRTLVGRPNDSQRSGVIIHPTQDMVVLYSVSSATAGEAFLTYCQEQFAHEDLKTTLEFHQLLDRCVTTAERMEVGLSLVGVWSFEDQIVLAALNGSVWLKRGAKHGQILSAEDSLQLLEGHTQENDVYVLFSAAAASLSTVVQPGLDRLDQKKATALLDLPEIQAAVTGAPEESAMGMTVVNMVDPDKKVEVPHPDFREESATVASPDNFVATVQKRNVLSMVSGSFFAVKNEFSQLFSQDVYVRQQHRRSLMKVAAVVILILAVIIGGLFYWRAQQAKQRQEVAAALLPYQTQLDAIKTLSLSDTVKARQNTELLITDLEAQSQKADQPKFIQTALVAELADVREYYQSISGQEELSTLPTFFDLRLVQSNFLASRIDATVDTLFFLDSGQKKILALNIEKKQPTILPVGEYPDIRAVTADNQFLYFLGEGLFRFTLSGTDVASIVENPDDTIKTGQALGLFDRYLYVMNKEQNNIFRYDTSDDTLDGKPVGWVQGNQGIDFSQVQSFAIDGDVWLTTQTGEIMKLTSGKQADFTVSGLKEAFSTPITIFTKPDMNNLYILEPQKSRVVVLNKSGQFIKEVKNENLAGATAVVASEKFQKAFALSGSLVYEIAL